MGEILDRSMRVVLHDITQTGAPEPRVEDRAWHDDVHCESVWLWALDGSGVGVWIDLGLPPAEALAQLADQVQEWIIEELGRTPADELAALPNPPDYSSDDGHHERWGRGLELPDRCTIHNRNWVARDAA